MKLHIWGGRLVDPAQGIDGEGDVWVEDGKIRAILKRGESPPSKPDVSIDAQNTVVAPGFIDLHVHLRDPGDSKSEDLVSGTLAAVRGGFTSVLCMPNTHPTNDCVEVTHYIVEKAKKSAHCRVYPVGALTLGLQGETLSPLSELAKAGCVAFSDDGRPVKNTQVFRSAMEQCKSLHTLVIEHCQDLDILGDAHAVETNDVTRTSILASEIQGRVHLAHLSCAASVSLVRQFKKKIFTLSAEVTPHHLFLTREVVLEKGTNAKMYPPLRDGKDRDELRKALGEGIIDVVATDHAPHSLDKKNLDFSMAANGVIGLETALPVLLTLVKNGELTLGQLVERMSMRPAQIANLPGGTLKPGTNADIVIFRQNETRIITLEDFSSKSQNSPFLGCALEGRVLKTFVAGREVYAGAPS